MLAGRQDMDRTNSQRDAALRGIPSLDAFTRRPTLASIPRRVLLKNARTFLDGVRQKVLDDAIEAAEVTSLFASDAADSAVLGLCRKAQRSRHGRVINGTGVVLHTGLGRAPLADAVRYAIVEASGYAIVEVDADTGERDQRELKVAELLCDLSGATGALVVNNNAAMVTLILTAIAHGREVVMSRGELVEIGGGFRMPAVMEQAGCKLIEVGTTNRTHLRDFRKAISERTGCLLKVHPSNFRMLGFTAMPTLRELAELAHNHHLPLIDDLGSGLLVEEPPPGLEQEPTVRGSLEAGVDLVCFSGDKLMGGPQSGILLGEREMVARIRAHPLYRALRCDKLTLAALEATLRIYCDGNPLADIPTLRLLSVRADELQGRAKDLARRLDAHGPRVVASESFAGSGANPARPLPSWAVALPGGERLSADLRGGDPPIVARIVKDEVWLDMRTLLLEDPAEIGELLRQRIEKKPPSKV